jgi:hypothetical protein
VADESTREILNARDAREWLEHAANGRFEDAWQRSDRIRARSGVHNARVPRHLQQIWDGSGLRGQRVLVRCYHGLGDTIQFIRYTSLLAQFAREVIVWAQPQLLDLLKSCDGIHRLLPLHDGAPDVEYDVDVEVMELPYVFRTTLSSIPHEVPYLRVCPRRLDGIRPRIGVAWRGSPWNEQRAIPFEHLCPLLERTDVTWYQLQHASLPQERHPRLHVADQSSMVRTAECMAALDLVISVDSMPAHLAGALGVRVWTLLTHCADWRWMETRVDSPWYPTMRLFRQPPGGTWADVITEVQAHLDDFDLMR